MYMYGIRQFAKNGKEQETFKQEVRIFGDDERMEFGMEKCAMLLLKCGKQHIAEGIELSN